MIAPSVRVVTAARAAARDAAAIAAGTPSRALMQRAGAAAATEIARRYPDRLGRGALVVTGAGNNGGDGWVVARAFAACGVPVIVAEALEPRTPDATAERALALRDGVGRAALADVGAWSGGIVVDALLGTGASGEPRGAIAEGMALVRTLGERGAIVVALDLPSGLDATSGDRARALRADLTLAFATAKRGHLVSRVPCGTIAVLDIGLGADEAAEPAAADAPLADARWVAARVPPIAADAHKGTRRRIAIVGGAPGMAGATILAARAALRSGAGMVKLVVAPESLAVVQGAVPAALGATWPADAAAVERDLLGWADAIVLGPGLGRGADRRALVERTLGAFGGPVLLDADALNAFAGQLSALAALLGRREALLTPHPAELARLLSAQVERVLAERFEIGGGAARESAATVLLKGTPTVVTAPDGRAVVSAAGSAVLATAGSGDLLAGICGTLLGQTDRALDAGACGAWVHGRAAELAARAGGRVRGATLDDVLDALPDAWPVVGAPSPAYPVLLELPALADG